MAIYKAAQPPLPRVHLVIFYINLLEDAVSQFFFRQRPDTRTMMRLKRSPEGKNHVRQNKMRKTETGKNHVRQNEIRKNDVRKNKTYENSKYNSGHLNLPSSLLSQ